MNFLVPELIRKKRDGGEFSSDEIHFLVRGFSSGTIADYQISAWLMATYFKGLSADEIYALTEAMKNSGECLVWPKNSERPLADKHSTGGVGDKVSLILAPLATCLGMRVPMMSGRGLGFTGGTLDKLQSIPGFNIFCSHAEMLANLESVGALLMAQSANLVPADKKLYSLRDVTGTVEELGLITGSIVSKKWAAGVEHIVYDVKCGSGAFMPDLASATKLAQSLVRVSKLAKMNASALITRMEEPLGAFVGNSLEVLESYSILKNEFPTPQHRTMALSLSDLCCTLVAEMAVLSKTRSNFEAAKGECHRHIESGAALAAFEKLLRAQGASARWKEDLPRASKIMELKSPRSGTLARVNGRSLGILGLQMGVGRAKSEDKIDPSLGFEILARPGQRLAQGQTLGFLHTREGLPNLEIMASFELAFSFSEEMPANESEAFSDSSILGRVN